MPTFKLPYLPENYEVEEEGLILILKRIENGKRVTIAFFSAIGAIPETFQKAVAEDQAKLAKEK